MPDTIRAYLLLGSNQGDRQAALEGARREIEEEAGRAAHSSAIYETDPWGIGDQPNFYNQVIAIDTKLEPSSLLKKLLEIEMRLGRVRRVRYGPRSIDIDILFYGDKVIVLPALTIPHPGIPDRRFTLVPLVEVAPTLVHPVHKQSMTDLLANCKDQLKVVAIKDLPQSPRGQSS